MKSNINTNSYPRPFISSSTEPFDSAEEAWFWFIDAYQARQDGARISAGLALVPRPCEPLDILQSVDRLYRTRRLLWDHLLVLRHYGQRKLPPDPNRIKEAKAATLWQEALQTLEVSLIRKGIVAGLQDQTLASCETDENVCKRKLEEFA